MKDFAQLDKSDVSAIAPKVIAKQIKKIAEARRLARQLLRTNRDLVGRPGRSIHLPKEEGTVSAEKVDEASTPGTSTVQVGADSVSVDKYGAMVQVTKEELESVELDVINYKIDRLGRALADSEDNFIISKFEEDGAAGTTVTGPISGYKVLDAVAAVRGNKYEPRVLFVNPREEGDLLSDEKVTFIDASTYGGREPILNGEIGKFAGCKVLVSQNVTAGKSLVVDPAESGWLVIKRDIAVNRSEYETAEKTEIAAVMEYGMGPVHHPAVAIITA